MKTPPAVPSFEFDGRLAAIDQVHAATALYTSTAVVDGLLDRIGWPCPGARLLDPSAGDGSFLERALVRLDIERDTPESVAAVSGWEFHAGAVREARDRIERFLTARGWSEAVAVPTARGIVVEADFLTDGPPHGEFRFIAGNPPYLRFGNWPEFFQELYSSRLPGCARGDLLHAFLERCTAMLPADGVIGLVIADRFLFNSTAAALRARLGERVGITHLARLDPSTSFYRPKIRRRGAPPRIHPVAIVLQAASRASRPLTSAPICPDESAAPAPGGRTLADIAQVRIAPWLGPEGIFVVDQAKAAMLGAADLVPAVDTDDIDRETDTVRPPRRVAIRTVRDLEPAGALRAHLRANASRMPKREVTRPYWLPPETITLPLDRPMLMIPRIARKLRAIPLPAGTLPINHNLSVVCSTRGVSLDRLAQLITSPKSQAWLARHAPRLENGYFSITTTLLRRLPVS
jgi:hypothetical protein